tara:strand:+ start:287 stop:796 length:510 start_codon:yes stop_codon:yes gene_type:complete
MNLTLKDTIIKGVKIINYDCFSDNRGTIWTTYNENYLKKLRLSRFTHDKFSVSKKNVIRGIHYDKKTTKLVTIVHGEIDQVVVDMREDSLTFKKFLKFRLNEKNKFSILIPPMVGNSFRVLSDIAVYHYKLEYIGDYVDHDEQYTLKWNDPTIRIDWGTENPILSERDK